MTTEPDPYQAMLDPTSGEIEDLRRALCNPFDPAELEWKPANMKQGTTKSPALAYLTARAVMDRLDRVLGPAGWATEYRELRLGDAVAVECALSIRFPGTPGWVTRRDVCEPSNIEGVKGAYSGALKRAAVQFGVGRYLYWLDSPWVDLDQRQRIPSSAIAKLAKSLPTWALPGGSGHPGQDIAPIVEAEPEDEPERKPARQPASKQKPERESEQKIDLSKDHTGQTVAPPPVKQRYIRHTDDPEWVERANGQRLEFGAFRGYFWLDAAVPGQGRFREYLKWASANMESESIRKKCAAVYAWAVGRREASEGGDEKEVEE